MKLTTLVVGTLAVLLFAVNAHATLIDRGNGLIYDDVNNISWTQDADISGIDNWLDQNTFAANLTLAGFDDFRLASSDELVSLWGQLPGGPNKVGDISPFEDIQIFYFSGTEASGSVAVAFAFAGGTQFNSAKANGTLYGWAVRAGDSAIPEPASILLLGAGLSTLLGVRRLRR